MQTNVGLTVRNATLSGGRHVPLTSPAEGGAIRSEGSVTISDSALVDNRAQTDVAGPADARGGAVYAEGDLVVERSRTADNLAQGISDAATGNAQGGALHGRGVVTIVDSVLSGDIVSAKSSAANANAQGGSAYIRSGADIRGSRFDGAQAIAAASTTEAADGGSLFLGSGGTGVIADSTVVGNLADGANSTGAGVFSGIDLEVRNSTIVGNAAGNGAGGLFQGTKPLALDHVTIAENSAPTYANAWLQGATTPTATVIAHPQGGTNCSINSGAVTSNGFKYDDDGTCNFDHDDDVSNGADPLLGPVRHNGDPVAAAEAGGDGTPRTTMFPLAGSPLIDAIPAGSCSGAPELDLDERGVDRPFGAGCDIGAIESVFPAHAFTDVTPFYEATVRWITSVVNTPQILLGFADGTFGQQLNITRGQAARLYYRAAGAPDVSSLPAHGFTDVTAFFEDAVRWTKAQGIFDGFADNTFRQADPITRGNFIRSLYGFAGAPDTTGLDPHGLSDVTPFYENAVKWAKHFGLADGFGNNTFRQALNITRGNATPIPYNLAQTPTAWNDPSTAPPNMLFRDNTP